MHYDAFGASNDASDFKHWQGLGAAMFRPVSPRAEVGVAAAVRALLLEKVPSA